MGHIVLRLDRVMADRKMSLNELSEKVGVANVNLSKMKNGHISAIRFSTLAAICEVLQCQPGDILEYSQEENADCGINRAVPRLRLTKRITTPKRHRGITLRWCLC